MFSLFDEITGKLLLSLHHGKRLKAKYPHACCWKWTFPPAMSKILSFSRHCDTVTGHGVCCGFSFLTEPPSVEGNLTSEPTPRVQSLEKEGIWTWLEEIFISSDMRGDIFLLNVFLRFSDDRSLPLVEKNCDSMASRAANRLRVDKVRTAGCFSVLP